VFLNSYNFSYKEKKALAFHWDWFCYLALCLWLILLNSQKLKPRKIFKYLTLNISALYSLYGLGGGLGGGSAINPFTAYPTGMTPSSPSPTTPAASATAKKDENVAGTFGLAASQAASLGMNQASKFLVSFFS
jgi:hypothetical protein